MSKNQKSYASEVVSHARARWVAGDSVRQICADLGIARSTAQGWFRGLARGPAGVVQLSEEAREVGQLGPVAPSVANSAAPTSPAVLEARPIDPLADYPELRQPPDIALPDIDQLAARLLVGSSNALAAIHRVVGLEDWLKGQDAASIASLYRVLAEKHLRVLEAVQRGNLEPDSDQAQDGS